MPRVNKPEPAIEPETPTVEIVAEPETRPESRPETRIVSLIASEPAAETVSAPSPDSLISMTHPIDGRPLIITENERKRSALRCIEKAGLYYLRRKIDESNGWG